VSDVEKGVPTSNAFEAELGRQVLASERERAGLLVLMGLGIFVTLGVVNLIQTARGQPLPAFKWALIVTIAATAYEWMIRQLFDRYLREGRELPGFIRYMTVALETSVPTLILVAFVYTMNVDTAMTSAAILTYFFFIILSALSLDVRLSVFAGIVAALGYVALILIYRDQLPLGAI
jgi:adenylate cyclase